jgi:LytR cell envelope-related transcriptional attenuator
MGSTAAIVVAVIAVVAGFLILRAINNDDSTESVSPQTSITTPTSLAPDQTQPTLATTTTTTVFVPVTEGAIVVVANASTVNGAAKVLTTALQGEKFSTGTPSNATRKQDATTILYDPSNASALTVAQSVALLMGNPVVQEMESPAPVEGGVLPDGASVLVMLGSDKANMTLDQMGNPTAVTTTVLPGVSSATG